MNLDKKPQDINAEGDGIALILGVIRFGRLEGANGPCVVAHLHDAPTLGCGMTPREACRDLASKLRQLATEIDAEANAPATAGLE